MKKLLTLILLMALIAPVAWAQTDVGIKQITRNEDGNPNTISEETLVTEYSDITSISNLMQTAADANNVANIQLIGNNNSASIVQNGNNNVGSINIDGYNNNDVSLNQSGNDLLSLINVEGSANTLSMQQSGNNLGNLLQVEGNGMNMRLEQDATGFRYFQGGGNVNPIQIESSGNYLPIIIKNN